MNNITKWVIGSFALLMSVLPSISSAQQIHQIDGLAVFDDNGKRVGPVHDLNPLVPFNVDGFIFSLGFKKTSVSGSKDFLNFELENCQGPPLWFIEGHEAESIFPLVITADQNANQHGLVVYAVDTDDFVGNIGFDSRYSQAEGCENSPGGAPIPLFKAKQIIDLGALFQPPFHVGNDVKQGAQSYDLNGDGKADLVWRNTANGSVGVWLMNGTKIFSTEIIGGAPSHWEIEQVADLNGDGKADLVWRDTNTGDVGVWLMDGVKEVIASSVSLEWEIQP